MSWVEAAAREITAKIEAEWGEKHGTVLRSYVTDTLAKHAPSLGKDAREVAEKCGEIIAQLTVPDLDYDTVANRAAEAHNFAQRIAPLISAYGIAQTEKRDEAWAWWMEQLYDNLDKQPPRYPRVPDGDVMQAWIKEMVEARAAAIQKARDDALEEAAKITLQTEWEGSINVFCKVVAAAIRSRNSGGTE